MTAKMSAARRRAFLAALRATGNQTVAAERAKVSRSWVCLHRSGDAAFRLAMAAARDRLASHNERRPPTGWGYLDGEELVVKGTGGAGGGKRVQIARARIKQWSPRVEGRFLATLAATCNVKAACAAVEMTAASAYAHRKRWTGFSARWDAAIEEGFSRLEAGLLEHAANVFSGDWNELDASAEAQVPREPMTVAQALQLLHMHKQRVHGLGKAPGKRWTRPPILDDPAIRESILRTLEGVVWAQEATPRQRRVDEADWRRRRGAPRG